MIFPMDKALVRFHGLVQIWSFECLQVLENMSLENSDVEENESELLPYFECQLEV